MLTLAWVYRTGRDLIAPRAGLLAVLLLSVSVFFLAYMIHARAFTLVALCSTLCIWSYWRLVLNPRPTSMGAPAGLLLGSVGLLYSHYFSCAVSACPRSVSSALRAEEPALVAARPPDRRRRPSGHVAAARLSGGTEGYSLSEVLGGRALTAPAVVSHFVRFLTNGLVAPSPPFSELLLLTVPLLLVIITIRRLRRGKGLSGLWLLVFTFAALLSLMIAVNEMFSVIVDNRIRYLMPLWPMMALLVGAGLWRLARSFRRLATVLLALWLISGTWLTVTTDFRYELGFFFRSDIHRVYRVLIKQVPETELLMIDKAALWTDRKRRLYSNLLDQNFNAIPVDDESLINNIWRTWEAYPSFWLLYLSQDGAFINDLAASLGLVQCELVLDEWGFTLERLARSGARCASDDRHIEFENNIRLNWSGISLSDELLHFESGLRSVDDYLLANYSLAVHVINPRNGERVAQGDVGVGPGAIVPLRSEIDISALPPGDYELRVALYDWQTGARLSARDLETGADGDMHTLHHFRLG